MRLNGSMDLSDKDLHTLVAQLEIVSQKELDQALKIAEESHQSLAKVLFDKSLVSDEVLGKIYADYYQLPFVILAQTVIDEHVLKIIPESLAREQSIIAFAKADDQLRIATSVPQSQEILASLSHKCKCAVVEHYATERDIKDAFRLYKSDLQKTFDEIVTEAAKEAQANGSLDLSITNVINLIIEYGYHDKASDIHIEPRKESTLIRFRIDGVLHDMLYLSRNLHDHLVTKIKVLSHLRTDEHLQAQDGKIQMKVEGEELDLRVSILPIQEGENIVLRLLTSNARQYSLTDLGMNTDDLQKVQDGFSKPFGMILSTGPTGSGKTTTMYAIIKVLNIRERGISTIEDPVEYEIEEVNQIQVNPKTNMTFAEGLRSILRQDPDIIYVGEIRDAETADIAVNSALTGHLVLSTLHTNDAATTFPRLVDMSIEPFLVASTVNVVIAQRLVRRICYESKSSYVYEIGVLPIYV